MTLRDRAEKLASQLGISGTDGWRKTDLDSIEQFARDIREECALVAEDDLNEGPDRMDFSVRWDGGASQKAALRIAAAIRKVGEAVERSEP